MRGVNSHCLSAAMRMIRIRPRGPLFSSPNSTKVGQLDVHSPQFVQRRNNS
jgi:hypothetical protein